MPVIIKKCKCDHDFQDKTYGKNKRVCNTMDKAKGCTCTVCGTIIR